MQITFFCHTTNLFSEKLLSLKQIRAPLILWTLYEWQRDWFTKFSFWLFFVKRTVTVWKNYSVRMGNNYSFYYNLFTYFFVTFFVLWGIHFLDSTFLYFLEPKHFRIYYNHYDLIQRTFFLLKCTKMLHCKQIVWNAKKHAQ